MRKILRLLVAFSLMVLVLPPALNAQERTITGTILSADNKTPLAGVNIRVKGTRRFTQTDANGNFSIRVNPGETLQVSYVGYEPQEIKPGDGNTLGISLKASEGTLGEVVVTAMDIKRNPRELGYSVQKVSGDDIQETQRENFLNSLQGRVAGLTIGSTSGVAGASSSIVLRGFNSLSLSNQPLFIVDGVIMDNQTIDENSGGGSGVGMVERTGLTSTSNRNTDYTNRMADLNPNDIETVTVLKGPEATALYGSLASSGAIVITPRKGKSDKLRVQYDNSFRIQSVQRFPEVYNGYMNGTNGVADDVFRYFGPAYPEGTKLYDNKDNFFRTGFAQTHNLGADFGIKGSIFRASASFFDQKGVVPENEYQRLTLRLSNTTKLFKDKVEIMPSVTYTTADNKKVLRSAGGFMISMLVWPNTADIRNFKDVSGNKIPLFSSNPNSDYDNPLWNVKYNKNGDETERLTATLGININPFDWLTVSGRFGYDKYDVVGYLRYHPQSYYISAGLGGLQDNFWRKVNNYNHTITATARKKFGDFSFRLMGGTMWIDNKTQMYAVSGTGIIDEIVNGKMYKDGIELTDQNFNQYVLPATDSSATKPSTRQRLLRNVYGEYNEAIVRQFAYFGEFAVSYKNLAFVNYTHRFEAASTLPEQNRNYNYPGASISLIMSDILPFVKKGNIISYWKLRSSLAGTARLNGPYSTQSVFSNNLTSGGGFSYAFTNANPWLGPERQKTYELGTEFRLFRSKLGLDVTYYNTLNEDQIIENFRLSYGTGYVLNTQNAGSTRNQGVEIVLNATVVKKGEFSWDMNFNFNRMWNEVVKLPANVAEYYIADTWLYGNARGGVQLGKPTTTITSYGYSRNDAGDILINPATGLPVIDATFKVHGDRNPDFTLGWNNQLRFRNWSLSFLWDLKVGGDVFNGTNMFMTGIGKSMLTADRMEPRVIEGVLNDGLQNTANPTKNTIVVVPYNNYLYYTGTGMPEEAFIEKDVNWFRLRDITLSYTFSQNFVRKIRGMNSLGFFITGNDLILLTNYSGADPGVNGNTAGGRGVGATGFDYGTLPAPISVNFGLRATF